MLLKFDVKSDERAAINILQFPSGRFTLSFIIIAVMIIFYIEKFNSTSRFTSMRHAFGLLKSKSLARYDHHVIGYYFKLRLS